MIADALALAPDHDHDRGRAHDRGRDRVRAHVRVRARGRALCLCPCLCLCLVLFLFLFLFLCLDLVPDRGHGLDRGLVHDLVHGRDLGPVPGRDRDRGRRECPWHGPCPATSTSTGARVPCPLCQYAK